MRESDFFALTAHLKEEQIAEAVTWKHRTDAGEEMQPAEVPLAESSPASLDEFFGTAPAEKTVQTKEPEYTAGSSREEMSNTQLRHLGIGIAAIAACFAVTVGVLAWKTHRGNPELSGVLATQSVSSTAAESTSAASSSEQTENSTAAQSTEPLSPAEDIAVQTVPTKTSETVQVITDPDILREILKIDHTCKEPAVGYAEGYVPQDAVQPNNDPNFLGGNGPLIPVAAGCLGYNGMVEDNDYYYFSNMRISKATGEQSRRCTDPDCNHTKKSCIENSYSENALLSDGEQLYYSNGGATLFTIGQDGTLKRFLRLENDSEGNPTISQNSYFASSSFNTVCKLTDGLYYICGVYQYTDGAYRSTHPESFVPFKLLYTPETGKIVWLPLNYCVETPIYSPERGTIISARIWPNIDDTANDTEIQEAFYEIDPDTGELLHTFALPRMQRTQALRHTLCWTVYDGMIYYTETQDSYATHDFSRFNPDTGQMELLTKDCDFTWFDIADGELYTLRRTEPISSAISRSALDGSGRQDLKQDGSFSETTLQGDVLFFTEYLREDRILKRCWLNTKNGAEICSFLDTRSQYAILNAK
ncbi:MAG TPA: hypothetical protein DDX71_00145 [Ruminococcus sp.]|nr:hypothetical protein [Ruminococcus sp.]